MLTKRSQKLLKRLKGKSAEEVRVILDRMEKRELYNRAQDMLKYARDVINGRFPKAEAVIARHAGAAYNYAKYVIKGKWPEGEPVIAQDAMAACWYAKDVSKMRLKRSCLSWNMSQLFKRDIYKLG